MATLFAEQALVDGRWARGVRITVSDGRIAALETQVDGKPDDQSVGILLPGMPNAHSHAFQRALVGRTEHKSASSSDTFWTWRELMYRVAGQLRPPELAAIARLAYSEMLTSGYTAVVEFHYLHKVSAEHGPDAMRDGLLAAADAAGIRLTYVPVYYEQAGFDGAELTHAQQRFNLPLDAFLEHAADSKRQVRSPHAVGVGAHSLRAVTPASLEIIASHAADSNIPMHLHIAEQQREVDDALAAYGQRPVRWLLDNTGVDARWTLVHATHIDADETRALAASGAVVCLCPSTEGNLGDGFFPLESYLSAGGRLAIGSDSQVTINPFEELRWLEYGQRLLGQRRNVAAVDQPHTGAALFNGAIAGGAQAAGRAPPRLAVGQPADLLSLDDGAAVLVGLAEDEVLDALVFGGLPSPIRRVMVDGVWRVLDGKHVSEAQATRDYRAAMARVVPSARP